MAARPYSSAAHRDREKPPCYARLRAFGPTARGIFSGTLRDALFYPQTGASGNPNADARTREVLEQVQLGHLTNQLDQPNDWARILSLGEQQRLAFGRLLLARPRLVFLDEATSAMDEGLEDAMYRLVRQQLPDTLIVSVGHRSTLLRHHSLQLNLEGEGRWALGSNPA
jgi:putative ATP-binding cassette transporter